MTAKHRPGEKGFSLVELMVALTILTIGMLAIGTMLKTSSEQSKRSVQNVLGDAIALELMEAVKSQATVNTLTELQNVRIQKLMPGSTTLYDVPGRDDLHGGHKHHLQDQRYDVCRASWTRQRVHLQVASGKPDQIELAGQHTEIGCYRRLGEL